MEKPTLKQLASQLETAVDDYCKGCAAIGADNGEAAFVLSDRWGAFRFWIAARVAKIKNMTPLAGAKEVSASRK